jgi:hypothetical protein
VVLDLLGAKTPEARRTLQNLAAINRPLSLSVEKADERAPQERRSADLCACIAMLVPGAQVARVIIRTAPIQSQCERHRLALGPITAEAHHLKRTPKALTLRQTYLVDNVTTSGHTLQAAHDALGFGTGLVFADAADRRTQLQATLF